MQRPPDHVCFHTASSDGAHTPAVRQYQHPGPHFPGRRAFPHDNGCHTSLLLFLFPFGIKDLPQQLPGVSAGTSYPVFYFNNLCHNGHTDLLRRLCPDIQTDGTVKPFQHGRIPSVFCHLLLHGSHPAAASDHTDVSMTFPYDLLQAYLIKPVSSGNDDKVGIASPLDPVQSPFKRIAQNLRGTRLSGVVRKQRPVLQNRHPASHHQSDLYDRYGHMTPSADDQMHLLAQPVAEYPVSPDLFRLPKSALPGKEPAKLFLILRKKTALSRLPHQAAVRKHCLLTGGFSFQNLCRHVLFVRVALGNHPVKIQPAHIRLPFQSRSWGRCRQDN